MTSVEKVAAAEQRILACINGQSRDLICPFCGSSTHFSDFQEPVLCCEPIAKMVDAICQRIKTEETVKTAAEIMDRFQEAQHAALVN